MPQGRVDHFGPFVVTLENVGADLGMPPFGLVIRRLANVVQQAAAPRQPAVQADFLGHHARSRNATSIECRSTFWL